MRAELIDPRDQTSQVDAPTYRVYFWAGDGSAKEEWELSGADLDDVLQWIPAHAAGRSHSLWAVATSPEDTCLIRLRGIDLDTDPGVWPAWARQTSSSALTVSTEPREPGLESPPPAPGEVDVWLTEWQVSEERLQVALDEIVAWKLVPMNHDWIENLFADRRTVPLQLDTYADATREPDAPDWTNLNGTVVRIDQVSVQPVPSAAPPGSGLAPERGATAVHAVPSIWPIQPHGGSVCGWIVRIRTA